MGMPISSGGSYAATVSQPLKLKAAAPAPAPAAPNAAASAAASTVDLLRTSGTVGTRLNTSA